MQKKGRPIDMLDLGKIPPHAIDLEEAVLGAVLMERSAYYEVEHILTEEKFYKEEHRTIWKAVTNLKRKSHNVDILTVTNELRRMGSLSDVGGAYTVAHLTSRVGATVNIEFHARVIDEKFRRRELIRISQESISDAFDDTTDTFDVLDRAEIGVTNIGRIESASLGHISDSVSKVHEDYYKAKRGENKDEGIYTQMPELDGIIGKMMPGDLFIFGARPSMGKTMTMLHIARKNAELGNLGLLLSVEMTRKKLSTRLLASIAEVNSEDIKNGTLNTDEEARFNVAIGKLENLPIHIEDKVTDINQLRAICRKFKKKHPEIKYIILDYLQKCTGKDPDVFNPTREQQMSYMSGTCKAIAKELDVVFIALSQLNRLVESRAKDFESKKPDLSDLRDSGSLEQDADGVVFPFRPAYYREYRDSNGEDITDDLWYIVRKHRDGAIGEAREKCNLRTQRILSKEEYRHKQDLQFFNNENKNEPF